jgi:hypothetical protein
VGDRHRDVSIRVLVEDDVAGSCIGKRACSDGVVTLGRDLKLEACSRDDAHLLEV